MYKVCVLFENKKALPFRLILRRKMQEHILEFYDVGTRIKTHRILHGVTFNVPTGHLFALLGPNGAGKTTIIRLIGGILPITEGKVTAFGKPLTRRTCDSLRQDMGFQSDSDLYQELSVEVNLRIWGELYDMDKVQIAKRISELADIFSFGQYLKQKAAVLSKGNKQKILIARAILSHPKLLMLDEPTNGLDLQTSQGLFAYLKQLMEENGMTIIITTHIFQELTYVKVQDVAFVQQGAIVETGNVQEIMSKKLVETYDLTIQDNSEALQYLSAIGELKVLERENGKIHVSIASPTADLETVINRLATSGVGIYGANKVQPTLEDLYSNVFSEGK